MKKASLVSVLFLLVGVFSCQEVSDKEKSARDRLEFDWKISGKLPDSPAGEESPGLAGAVIGIVDDYLIIGGGSNFPDAAPWDGGTKTYYKEVFVFKKEGDSIIALPDHFDLPYHLAYSVNISSDKGMYVLGGEEDSGAVNSALFIHKEGEDWKVDSLPALPRSLTAGAGVMADSILYFAGGQNAEGASDNLYALDLKSSDKKWKKKADLPQKTAFSILLEAGSKLYLVGGRQSFSDAVSDIYKEVYEYDIEKDYWTEKEPLPYPLAAHTGISMNDELLIFSGDKGKTFHQTEELLLFIAEAEDLDKIEKLTIEKDHVQKNHPGFEGIVLKYNPQKDAWIKTDSIPFAGQVTSTAIKWNDEIIIPGGEIRAGIRTPNIIKGSLKSN